MKTLLLDIETAPNVAYVWGLFKQNVALNQLEATSHTLCWSAKWLGEEEIAFRSVQKGKGGEKRMLLDIHKRLDSADAVVHFNGQKFDIPTLNKEFVKHGMRPPSPYKQIDLYRVCKQAFRFESNKLAFILRALGIGGKVAHEGFTLWVKCMKGDPEAWKRMEQYNRGDVVGLEALYKRLTPWIKNHPNVSAYRGVECCPKCGSDHFQSRGQILTTMNHYKRYQCVECGGWFRGNKTTSRAVKRMVNV